MSNKCDQFEVRILFSIRSMENIHNLFAINLANIRCHSVDIEAKRNANNIIIILNTIVLCIVAVMSVSWCRVAQLTSLIAEHFFFLRCAIGHSSPGLGDNFFCLLFDWKSHRIGGNWQVCRIQMR